MLQQPVWRSCLALKTQEEKIAHHFFLLQNPHLILSVQSYRSFSIEFSCQKEH